MEQKAIIVDLFGVLVLVNKRIFLYQLGLWQVMLFYIKYHMNPLDYCLLLLDKMRLQVKGEFQDVVHYRDFYLPNSLCLWQKGLLSDKRALEKVSAYINNLPETVCYNKNLMLVMVRMVFSPKGMMKAIYLNKPLYDQL